MPGIGCAFFAIVIAFEEEPIMLFGSIANILILANVLVNWYVPNYRSLKTYCIINMVLGSTSVLSWFLYLRYGYIGNGTLLIGYYTWAFSVIATSVVFYFYREELYKWGVAEREKGKEIEDHLIGNHEL